MLLIIVHELGHFFTAKYFNWEIDRIYIYPLGGLTKFKTLINKPLKEELLVTIMGPIFQILFFNLIKDYDDSLYYFNNLLLIFNLLPVVPLDGGKLLNIFTSTIISFKKTLKLGILISYAFYPLIIIFFITNINSVFMTIVTILLILKIIEESKNIDYIFNKFLLERYLRKFKYRKDIVVKKVDNYYKYKNNIIINNKQMLSEKDALRIYYK